jgi:hypothetical protein
MYVSQQKCLRTCVCLLIQYNLYSFLKQAITVLPEPVCPWRKLTTITTAKLMEVQNSKVTAVITSRCSTQVVAPVPSTYVIQSCDPPPFFYNHFVGLFSEL